MTADMTTDMTAEMKPVIFYVDDEPNNLTVFEAIFPAEWEIRTFSNPFEALKALESVTPWVIVSDQRMRQTNGVEFLQLARKLRPEPIRILTTGYSDEAMVVESVKKAQIYDYIRKPWDEDELQASLARAIDLFRSNEESRVLHLRLKEREATLARQNDELRALAAGYKESLARVAAARSELECWVPPFLLWMLEDRSVTFPLKKDIVGIAFDIIRSSEIHGIVLDGKPLRGRIIQAFSESILRHGGWRESHSGDSAYGHFGLVEDSSNPYDRALAAAREFRVSLKSLSDVHGIAVECGISLHLCRDSTVDVHTVRLETSRGVLIQKSFDTASKEIDLLHRMEKSVHDLPGSNIILSGSFAQGLVHRPPNLRDLGSSVMKGQTRAERLYLIPSQLVTEEVIEEFRSRHGFEWGDEEGEVPLPTAA